MKEFSAGSKICLYGNGAGIHDDGDAFDTGTFVAFVEDIGTVCAGACLPTGCLLEFPALTL